MDSFIFIPEELNSLIPLARHRLNLFFCTAESAINGMFAELTGGRCLSGCVNGLFAYIVVAIIAHEIIFHESFRLMTRQRTPNTIHSFICHQRKVSKFFSAT